MAPYKILKQGYMLKEPPLSKRGIRKRLFRYWFVLVEDRNQVALVYFKTEEAYLTRQKNEGFIRVDESQNISVIGDYMGHKNAFVVKTPKGEYHLLPESRYDLHEWLFTLHTALENFQKRMQRNEARRRQQQPPVPRPRANTVDSQHKPSATAGHTPPYRRAPPPPKSNGGQSADTSAKPDGTGRRKPVRPAPVAPGRRHSQDAPPTSPGNGSSQQLPQETPPPHYSASLPSDEMRARYETEQWMSQEGYGTDQDPFGTMGSGQHMVVDLNITQTDELSPGGVIRDEIPVRREILPGADEISPGDEISTGEGSQSQENRPPSPMHVRSSSDSLLLYTASNSLPDLINEDSSTSPDNPEEFGCVAKLPRSPNPNYGHTRHLSLMGGSFRGPNSKHGHKKKPKRASSVKQRSRSPPNLPPPPPPPMQGLTSAPGAPPNLLPPPPVQGPTSPPNLPPPPMEGSPHISPGEETDDHSLSHNPTSLEFSSVLNAITDIDQQLDHMTHHFKPAESSPIKMGNVASILFEHPKLGKSPAPEHGKSPAPEHGSAPLGSEEGTIQHFHEEEWLCDSPHPPKELHDVGPPPHFIGNRETTAHDKPTNDVGPPPHFIGNGETTAHDKPTKAKHRVMFKEEVEDIPNYDPRVDLNSPPSEDELATGIAAIKMKLFGDHEQEATRYKKEGVLCPKYTHPENTIFSADYFEAETTGLHSPPNGDVMGHVTTGQRDSSPNANNNNSEEESTVNSSVPPIVSGSPPEPTEGLPQPEIPASPVMEDPEEPKQNLYDCPWEQKAVSKVVRRSVSPAQAKEKTPPPIAPKKLGSKIQFGEVSVKETPRPIATELRNVHSLERKHKSQHSQGRASTSPQHPQGRASTSPQHLQGRASTRSQGRSSASPPPPQGKEGGDSLLASISNTLQVTSRYGSDSFLSNGDSNTNLPQAPAPVKRRNSKISSRGELEKIKAAHRKEAMPNVPHPSPLIQAQPIQHSSPQINMTTRTTPYKQVGVAKGGIGIPADLGRSPRMATSLEALQRRPDTRVTYDVQTQAHIFRSLV